MQAISTRFEEVKDALFGGIDQMRTKNYKGVAEGFERCVA
jgi:hypothetical protein